MAEARERETLLVLTERVQRVREELRALDPDARGRDGAAVPQYGKRAGDHIADAMEHRRNVLASQELRREMEALEHALGKLERGTYGICDRCGQVIDPDRLEALPSASLCIDCKRQTERRRR